MVLKEQSILCRNSVTWSCGNSNVQPWNICNCRLHGILKHVSLNVVSFLKIISFLLCILTAGIHVWVIFCRSIVKCFGMSCLPTPQWVLREVLVVLHFYHVSWLATCYRIQMQESIQAPNSWRMSCSFPLFSFKLFREVMPLERFVLILDPPSSPSATSQEKSFLL